MGAWGNSVFENDAAADWMAALLEDGRQRLIGQTLAAVADGSNESDDCSAALAAAEVVAAARGWPAHGFPKELKQWITEFDFRPTDRAKSLSIDVVNKVRDGSELAELWSENSKQLKQWRAGLSDLLERLENKPQQRPATNKPKHAAADDVKEAIKRLKAQRAYIQTTPSGQVKYVHTRKEIDDNTLAACLPFATKTKVLRIGMGGLMPTPERLQVTDAAFASLDQFKSLQELSLINTQITDATLTRLTDLAKLRVLELTGTNVSAAGMQTVRSLAALEKLTLGLTAVTDVGMAYLTGLKNLKVLNLFKTTITDQGLEHLAGLTKLMELDLRYTKITGVGLRHLAKLTNLWILELDHTLIDDEGLSHLSTLTKLERLTIRGRRVTDEAMNTISQMTALRGLVVENTRISDAALPTFAALPKLEIVQLTGTSITTEGARWLRKTCPKLTVQGKDK